jgi:pyruvate,water dikinase
MFTNRCWNCKLPVIRKNIGSKLIKMEFTGEAKAGRSVKTVDVPIELRNAIR